MNSECFGSSSPNNIVNDNAALSKCMGDGSLIS